MQSEEAAVAALLKAMKVNVHSLIDAVWVGTHHVWSMGCRVMAKWQTIRVIAMRDAWKPVIAAWIMSKSVMYNVSAIFYYYYINNAPK